MLILGGLIQSRCIRMEAVDLSGAAWSCYDGFYRSHEDFIFF
jgi:hypothetical protein